MCGVLRFTNNGASRSYSLILDVVVFFFDHVRPVSQSRSCWSRSTTIILDGLRGGFRCLSGEHKMLSKMLKTNTHKNCGAGGVGDSDVFHHVTGLLK